MRLQRLCAGLLLLGLGLTAALPAGAQEANCTNRGSFSAWMADFRREAVQNGVSERTLASALNGVSLDQRIIQRDRRQGFFAQSFNDFSKKLATNHRVQAGRKKIATHRRTFERAEQTYGIPAEVITAFWALESDFGAGMGDYPVLQALATLAYDCRRHELFRGELLSALKIIERGDLRASDMVGSWAGELGQTQFLPTHYLNHAVDFDGDGHANLFKSDADIIGSTAAYLKHLGWRAGEPWLQEVVVTGELPWHEADLAIKHPRTKWVNWGIKLVNGKPLPNDSLAASLVLPMGRHGPAFLAYHNFDIYVEWNQSFNYATTAAYLATRIGGAGPMKGQDRNIPTLTGEETKELQKRLKNRGFDVGKIDGIMGAKTRAAVKAMQMEFNLPADSYPTVELLRRLSTREARGD